MMTSGCTITQTNWCLPDKIVFPDVIKKALRNGGFFIVVENHSHL